MRCTCVLLIDKKLSNQVLTILNKLKIADCEIRGDHFISQLDDSFKLALEDDWNTEYLDKLISVKIVDGVLEAVSHINKHSSNHTESIITESTQTFQTFYKNINSAIILFFVNLINFSRMFNYSTEHYLKLYEINLSPKR